MATIICSIASASVACGIQMKHGSIKQSGFRQAVPSAFSHSLFQSSYSTTGRRASKLSVTASATVVTEPATGVTFPTTIVAPGASSELSLAGAGFREKAFGPLKFKVYAVALYLEPSALAAVSSWGGRAAAELQKDEAFYAALAESSGQRALLIVLNRDVDGKTFAGALSEELTPRLQALGAGQQAQAEFEAVVKSQNLTKGTAVFLVKAQEASLQLSIIPGFAPPPPAAAQSSFASAPLLTALFDIFLGAKGVSPTLRESIASTLAAKI